VKARSSAASEEANFGHCLSSHSCTGCDLARGIGGRQLRVANTNNRLIGHLCHSGATSEVHSIVGKEAPMTKGI